MLLTEASTSLSSSAAYFSASAWNSASALSTFAKACSAGSFWFAHAARASEAAAIIANSFTLRIRFSLVLLAGGPRDCASPASASIGVSLRARDPAAPLIPRNADADRIVAMRCSVRKPLRRPQVVRQGAPRPALGHPLRAGPVRGLGHAAGRQVLVRGYVAIRHPLADVADHVVHA